MWEAHELRAVIDNADVQLRAMLLLGINCGFGNSDCANLPLTALDLEGGWINFPRPKTGIERRCPLWKETITALRAAIAKRKKPAGKRAAGLVFVTLHGLPYNPKRFRA